MLVSLMFAMFAQKPPGNEANFAVGTLGADVRNFGTGRRIAVPGALEGLTPKKLLIRTGGST